MTAPSTSAPRRNRLGIAALVLVLVAVAAPLLAWIAVAIVGAVQEASFDDAVYVGLLGGLLVFGAVTALVSPLAIAGVVLGVVSLFRRGRRKAPGVVAIALGALPALVGPAGLPVVLGEILPR